MTAGRRLLVDTSAWIEALRADGDPAIRAAVSGATDDGTAVLCDMVLVELWNGAQGESQHKVLRDLEELVESVPTSDEVWARARQLARDSRSAGLTIPAADLVIAACARHHGLEVLHRDRHFDRLKRLQEARR